MSSVSFFDCITGQGWFTDLSNRCLYIDGLSNRFGKRRFSVVRTDGLQTYLQDIGPKRFSFLISCAKIVLICTLLIPLIMILVKRRNLSQHEFVIEHEPETLAVLVKPVKVPHKQEISFQPQVPHTDAGISFPAAKNFSIPEFPVYIPPSTVPWPVAKSRDELLSKIPPLQKPVENNVLTLKVDRDLATQASPVLEAACRSQMREAKENCYASPTFDNGVLQMIAPCIQEKTMPPLTFEQLIEFYKATDQLQMKEFEVCRQKFIQRLLYDDQLSESQLLSLCVVAEQYQDETLLLLCMNHRLIENMELPETLGEKRALFKKIAKPVIDEEGSVSISTLTLDGLLALQQLGVKKLHVHTLFETAIADQMRTIKCLTIADRVNFHLEAELITFLLKDDTGLETLKLCYCNLNEIATLALATALRANSRLKALVLTAVGLHQNGLSDIMDALRTNRSLTFLHVSHHEFNENQFREALKENQTLKTISFSGSLTKI